MSISDSEIASTTTTTETDTSNTAWPYARLKRPLVTTQATLHDLWRFGYALLEMCKMVCGIPYSSVDLRNPSVERATVFSLMLVSRCVQIFTTVPGRFSGPV